MVTAILIFASDRQVTATVFFSCLSPEGWTVFPQYYLPERNAHWKRPWLIKNAVAFLLWGEILTHTHIYAFLTANSNPCEHAGKCVNTEGSFHCECLKGYTGPRCEMDINECHSNPCQNDATCLDKIGGFTCLCMPGEGSFWQRWDFQHRKKPEGRAQGELLALLRWNTKLQRGEAKWWESLLGGTSQEDLAFVCEREKAIRGLRKKPISASVKEVSFLSWVCVDLFVTIPGKVHVQSLLFVKSKQL